MTPNKPEPTYAVSHHGDNFPDDIWRDAGLEALQYVEWLVPKPTEYNQAEYVLTVSFARLIMAERERCATAANSFTAKRETVLEVEYYVNDRHGGDARVEDFVPVIADRIAAAISKGPTP